MLFQLHPTVLPINILLGPPPPSKHNLARLQSVSQSVVDSTADAEMNFGVFTTSTMMSRNIKVSSIMKNDVMPYCAFYYAIIRQQGVRYRNLDMSNFRFRLWT
ncbi:hypothetical protein ACEPPN_005770 [Leptodophora sp. 'Broadleaf-Isolate-01']